MITNLKKLNKTNEQYYFLVAIFLKKCNKKIIPVIFTLMVKREIKNLLQKINVFKQFLKIIH